eukprot:4246994-Pyramimonas_sp.AAC.1
MHGGRGGLPRNRAKAFGPGGRGVQSGRGGTPRDRPESWDLAARGRRAEYPGTTWSLGAWRPR